MNNLISELIREGYLKTDSVIDAFSEIDRVEFLPQDLEREAHANVALPIGYGQTISQPATVAIMLELLDLKKGQNVLDIGLGSGWTTALLCYIVGRQGRVTAVERNKELLKWGKSNVDKYDYLRNGEEGVAEFYLADGSKGFKKNAPYDRILVSASAETVPQALKKQLDTGGKMVIPIKNSLWYLEKNDRENFSQKEYPGFTFVPLVTD